MSDQIEAAQRPEIEQRLALAIRIAKMAGEQTLRYFKQKNYFVELKEDRTPVTIADQSAEKVMRKAIAEAFPQDSILGEEFGESRGESDYYWILDPIDGTKSFISGVPLYSTLVGLVVGEQPVAGVIYLPALDEGVYASLGAGAWHFQGEQTPELAQVSGCPDLHAALFLTSEVKTFAERSGKNVYSDLEEAVGLARTWGDGYGYFLLATGHAELMIDPVASIWDIAPMLPIITEAGGTFTNWQGEPTIRSEEAVATNGLIFDDVMKILQRQDWS